MTHSQAGSASSGYHCHVRSDVVPHVPKAGGPLLDFGGGTGATAEHLRERGFADRAGVVDQIDNSNIPTQLDFVYQADLEDEGLIERIVAEQGQFQTILALDVLEHLRDPWRVAEGLAKALVDGGHLIVSLPNVRNYRALIPLLLQNRWDYKDAGILDRTHLRFFVRGTAIDLVRSTKLEIESVAPSASGGRKIAWFRKLTLGLLNGFTDRQYIIVARKAPPMEDGG